MLPDLGFYLVFISFIASIYGAVASVGSGFLRHRRLYRSARMAALASTFSVLSAALVLWYLFFTRDYSVSYIFRNSSNDLPSLYTLTAFWSSMEGSHFFWTLLMTLMTSAALWTAARDNEHIMPHVSACLQAVLAWMLYLLISHSDPFKMIFPPPSNGQGMNELLQNPYMAIHPPSLFVGYTAMAIPFAYGMAALIYGDITEGWLRTTRRWVLFGWCFLTAGIFLGGRWAYVELGWAGYWAWDPVENSSFLPWLFATALLHSLIVQEKLGHLKRLSIILAFFAFFMSFFGTFITRSGVITSVHSFAESAVGPNYLIFLAVLCCLAFVLYAWRAPMILPSETERAWGVSKESALVITQFLLLTFAVIVFIGTIYPIVSEAVTGERTSVQAPYFNAFAPYIGLALIVAIALGNIMRYHTHKIPGGKSMLIYSGVAALPVALLFSYRAGAFQTPDSFSMAAQLVGSVLTFWCFFCLCYDLFLRMKSLQFRWSWLWKKNRGYLGGFIAHVGFLIAILGFLGNYQSIEKKVTLSKGESTEFFGYHFTFEGMSLGEHHNATLFQAPLLWERGNRSGRIIPAQSRYPTKAQLFNEIAIETTLWHDLYVVLADFERPHMNAATLEIHINPTVRFVWISVFVMVLGGIISLADPTRGLRGRDVL